MPSGSASARSRKAARGVAASREALQRSGRDHRRSRGRRVARRVQHERASTPSRPCRRVDPDAARGDSRKACSRCGTPVQHSCGVESPRRAASPARQRVPFDARPSRRARASGVGAAAPGSTERAPAGEQRASVLGALETSAGRRGDGGRNRAAAARGRARGPMEPAGAAHGPLRQHRLAFPAAARERAHKLVRLGSRDLHATSPRSWRRDRRVDARTGKRYIGAGSESRRRPVIIGTPERAQQAGAAFAIAAGHTRARGRETRGARSYATSSFARIPRRRSINPAEPEGDTDPSAWRGSRSGVTAAGRAQPWRGRGVDQERRSAGPSPRSRRCVRARTQRFEPIADVASLSRGRHRIPVSRKRALLVRALAAALQKAERCTGRHALGSMRARRPWAAREGRCREPPPGCERRHQLKSAYVAGLKVDAWGA